jgi:hypothetical protein
LLLVAVAQMVHSVRPAKPLDRAAPDAPPFLGSLLVGGIIGLVSGVTGVGGGIFLAPLVLSLGWATTRQTAAISVVFNLVNSAAALAGTWATLALLPARLPLWLISVGVRGGARFMDGCAAPEPTNIAVAAGFSVAHGGWANDRCLFLAMHATTPRYEDRSRRFGVTPAARARPPPLSRNAFAASSGRSNR